jgi:hypothetical protein
MSILARVVVPAFCIAAWQPLARAQQLVRGVQILPNGQIIEAIESSGGEAPTMEAQAVAAAQDGAASEPGAGLLAKLKQAQFDRRPSVILQAWAKPEPKTSEQEDAEKAAEAKTDAKKPTEAKPDAVAATSPPAADQPAEPAPTKPAAEQPGTGEAKPAGQPNAQPDPAKAAEEAKRKQLEERKQKRAVEVLQRAVTLGRWADVRAFLQSLPEKDRMQGWEHILRSLGNPPFLQQQQQQPANLRENNAFNFADVFDVIAAAPQKPDRKQIALLAPITQRALDTGHAFEELLAALRGEVQKPETEQRIGKRSIAFLLTALGKQEQLLEFLPSLEEATKSDDREALNLLGRAYLALHTKEKKTAHLESTWQVTQAVLAAGKVNEEDKVEALRRAVDIAPKINKELGEAWLIDGFTARPERGMEILATIGSAVAAGFQQHAHNPGHRLKSLELTSTAVRALLQAAPERANAWRDTLNLLANNWIREAGHSYAASGASSRGPLLQRDQYGNIYYQDMEGDAEARQAGGAVQPVKPGELLPLRPSDAWAEMLDAAVRPRFAAVTAQLHLKLNEAREAFPYIESLVKTHPKQATDLAREFLRVWIRNHNPNQANQYTSHYMYMYGFEERRNSIPLTRSKQERSLAELAEWVGKLRTLPLGELDEKQLVDAFTKCHSTAEVYKLEAIEKVFGALDKLKPATLAALTEQMRRNLLGVWRRPNVQEQAGTKRNQKDIEREVLAGYATANAVLERGLAQHAGHWALQTSYGAMQHDLNDFKQEVAKNSEFAANRVKALSTLADACVRYTAVVESLPEEERTVQPFETWFYAALGAAELGMVSENNVLVSGEPARVRAALDKLPGEHREKHLGWFANNLFTRMSAVRPNVKHRYLKAGFEIVGDHKQAFEAKKVFDYYKDLVTELKLEAVVDGPDRIGAGVPFGVRVNLRHTREIERESGGFAKYLQNQNNQPYAYNYGRPLENYRDKFQEAAAQALQEHFEILSVTFNAETVTSKATAEYGWRVTPYAYLLLKAKGPQVDKLPALKLDLDFLDTSGYAVLPIESAAVPVDASAGAPRPYTKLEVMQTLDERKAGEGKLIVEVKATALGLVPDFAELLAFGPSDFDVAKSEDQGLSVTKFADDQENVVSERTWMVTLQAKPGQEAAKRFKFASAKTDGLTLTFQRYADADVVKAEPEVELLATYGDRGFPWLPVGLGLGALLAAGGAWFAFGRRKPSAAAVTFRVPEPATPFAVLGMLRQVQQRNAFTPDVARDLSASIATIEQHYFSPSTGAAPDLRQIAESWVRRLGPTA